MPTDPRVDQYIAGASPFARPILEYLRELVHQACPDTEETIKWGRPMFLHQGKILCFVAAFKAHCAFGFWDPEMGKRVEGSGAASDTSSGSFGRITGLSDLPPKRVLLSHLRDARQRIEDGAAKSPLGQRNKFPKPEAAIPEDLSAALAKDKVARQAFDGFSPSHRREYVEWITEAKRAETREKRIATTLEWLVEGKPRNWKHM